MFEAWIKMWKDGLKFKSPYRTNRRDFWCAFVVDIIVAIGFSALWKSMGLTETNIVFISIILIHLVVVTAIEVRRLRDAGFGIYWPIFYAISAFLAWISEGSFSLFFGAIAMVVCIVIFVLCALPTKNENAQPIQEDINNHSC